MDLLKLDPQLLYSYVFEKIFFIVLFDTQKDLDYAPMMDHCFGGVHVFLSLHVS